MISLVTAPKSLPAAVVAVATGVVNMGAVDMGAVEAATILAEAMEAVTIKPITAMGPARPAMAIRETRGAVIQVTTGTMAETIGALRPISVSVPYLAI